LLIMYLFSSTATAETSSATAAAAAAIPVRGEDDAKRGSILGALNTKHYK